MSSSPQADSRSYDVHLGFWTNWSAGKIKGATITLTRQDGGLLVAFLALFTATTGRSLWRIICFILHHYFSSAFSPQDGLYHQRQAVLRNSEEAASGSWQLFKMTVCWKKSKSANRIFRRLIPIMVTGIIVFVCFAVAGMFSSSVTTKDANQVLLTGDGCGILNATALSNDVELMLHTWSQDARRAQTYLDYVRTCYKEAVTHGHGDDGCGFYVKPRLSLNVDRNASCPFAEEVCHSATGNLKLDTGHINSHDDLGINVPPEYRFSLRVIHHCAPLKSEGFTRTETEIDRHNSNTTVRFSRVYYGAWTNISFPEYRNYTFQKSIPHTRTMSRNILGLPTEYELGIVEWVGRTNRKQAIRYEPIPQLQVADADLALFFLSAPFVSFQEPVDDPWFSAHKTSPPVVVGSSGNSTSTRFLKDEIISTVACTTQQQVCNPNRQNPENMRCENLRSEFVDFEESTNKLWDSEKQKNAFNWVYKIIVGSRLTIVNLVDFAGATALVARLSLFGANQGILPANQWQIEIENMASASLASLQDVFVDASKGPRTAKIAESWTRVEQNNSAAMLMCQNQKVISAKYLSFSVLGLSIILVIGVLFITLELSLEPATKRIRNSSKAKKNDRLETAELPRTTVNTDRETETQPLEVALDLHKAREFRRMEWNATSTLQLQRLAHEGVGYGTWHRTSSDIPVTSPNQMLAVIGFKGGHMKHPYLVPENELDTNAHLSSQQSLAVDHKNTMVGEAEKSNNSFQTDTNIETTPIETRELNL